MRPGNGTGPRTVRVSREEDFAIFDTLPPDVRQAMNGALFNYAAHMVSEAVLQVGPDRVVKAIPASDQVTLDAERRKAALAAAQKEARRRVFA